MPCGVVIWQQGIESAKSMAGGIERWSLEVDPQVPRSIEEQMTESEN